MRGAVHAGGSWACAPAHAGLLLNRRLPPAQCDVVPARPAGPHAGSRQAGPPRHALGHVRSPACSNLAHLPHVPPSNPAHVVGSELLRG